MFVAQPLVGSNRNEYTCLADRSLSFPMALNRNQHHYHGPLTRYVQLRVAHASWMPGMFSSHRLHRKPLVSDPGMQHDMCVTHVPWCMSGSLTRGGGENVPSACATRNFMYLVRGPYRVPQGFALGLFLFTIYILPLGEIIKKIGMQFYMYTEDWHIYMYTILQHLTSIRNI